MNYFFLNRAANAQNTMQPRFLLLVLLPLIAAAQPSPDLRLRISTGAELKSDTGVLWESDPKVEDYETLVALLAPSTTTVQNTFFHQSFVLRSSDMSFRFRVTVDDSQGNDPEGRPFRITFHNLNHDKKNNNLGNALELQHGKSGFVWMEGGKEQRHHTFGHKQFTIRDGQKKVLANFEIFPIEKPKADL